MSRIGLLTVTVFGLISSLRGTPARAEGPPAEEVASDAADTRESIAESLRGRGLQMHPQDIELVSGRFPNKFGGGSTLTWRAAIGDAVFQGQTEISRFASNGAYQHAVVHPAAVTISSTHEPANKLLQHAEQVRNKQPEAEEAYRNAVSEGLKTQRVFLGPTALRLTFRGSRVAAPDQGIHTFVSENPRLWRKPIRTEGTVTMGASGVPKVIWGRK